MKALCSIYVPATKHVMSSVGITVNAGERSIVLDFLKRELSVVMFHQYTKMFGLGDSPDIGKWKILPKNILSFHSDNNEVTLRMRYGKLVIFNISPALAKTIRRTVLRSATMLSQWAVWKRSVAYNPLWQQKYYTRQRLTGGQAGAQSTQQQQPQQSIVSVARASRIKSLMLYDQMCDQKASLGFTAHEIIRHKLAQRQPRINNQLVKKLSTYKGLLEEYSRLRSDLAATHRNWDDPLLRQFDVFNLPNEQSSLQFTTMKANVQFPHDCKFYDSFQDKWFNVSSNKITFKPFVEPKTDQAASMTNQWIIEVSWDTQSVQPCTISPKNVLFYRASFIANSASFTVFMARKRKYYVFNFENQANVLLKFMKTFFDWLNGENRSIFLHQGCIQDYLTEPKWRAGKLKTCPAQQVTSQLLNNLFRSITSKEDENAIFLKTFIYGAVSLNFSRLSEMNLLAEKYKIPEKNRRNHSLFREISRRVALDCLQLVWQMSTLLANKYATTLEELCREKVPQVGALHYFGKELTDESALKLKQMRQTYSEVQALMKAFYGSNWPINCRDGHNATLQSRFSLFNAPH